MNADWWPAGAHLSMQLGQRYACIATASGGEKNLFAPPPKTLEAWLSQQSESPRLYASQALLRLLFPTPEKRENGGGNPAYFPLSPERLLQTDGLLFLPT